MIDQLHNHRNTQTHCRGSWLIQTPTVVQMGSGHIQETAPGFPANTQPRTHVQGAVHTRLPQSREAVREEQAGKGIFMHVYI